MIEVRDEVRDALKAYRTIKKFLNEHFDGGGCDGTQFGCMGCDAKRLNIELERFFDEVRFIYADELKEQHDKP